MKILVLVVSAFFFNSMTDGNHTRSKGTSKESNPESSTQKINIWELKEVTTEGADALQKVLQMTNFSDAIIKNLSDLPLELNVESHDIFVLILKKGLQQEIEKSYKSDLKFYRFVETQRKLRNETNQQSDNQNKYPESAKDIVEHYLLIFKTLANWNFDFETLQNVERLNQKYWKSKKSARHSKYFKIGLKTSVLTGVTESTNILKRSKDDC